MLIGLLTEEPDDPFAPGGRGNGRVPRPVGGDLGSAVNEVPVGEIPE